MKTIFLLAIMLITTSALVQATSPGAGIKSIFSKKGDENKSRPNNVVVIDIDQLRAHTKDVSILKPVFFIVSAIERVTEKLHERKLKITCNKSADKRD
ncbi:MAG TPA: hypothetical protein VE978_16965 [Chitinophagales bacterium]|nr:hypothetical protein [Chitinophagales bacterium]